LVNNEYAPFEAFDVEHLKREIAFVRGNVKYQRWNSMKK
jgi:hypothetical protein